MPIEVGIWRIDSEDVMRVASSKLVNETRLEDIARRTSASLDSTFC